ncbi:MAG: hypothetical protein RBT63_09120, partial [Bdellovibrionales bacterium]|nr:hypothetical protein [Bdellovibrionales bacterium]
MNDELVRIFVRDQMFNRVFGIAQKVIWENTHPENQNDKRGHHHEFANAHDVKRVLFVLGQLTGHTKKDSHEQPEHENGAQY